MVGPSHKSALTGAATACVQGHQTGDPPLNTLRRAALNLSLTAKLARYGEKLYCARSYFGTCTANAPQQSGCEKLGINIIAPAIIFFFLVGFLGYILIFKLRNDRFDDSARHVLSK